MKKLFSIATMALLLSAGVIGAETMGSGDREAMQTKPMMADGQKQGGGSSAPQPNAPGQPAPKTDMKDMGMMGMGQAMMPYMMNMMMAESPMPGGMKGGKMMNMPMMGASMMPMGMGGMGMMPLMMGGSSDETAATLEKFRAFLKETRNTRKELHDLAFAYFEARWTPTTTVQELQDMSLKMRKLRDQIMAKMPK